MRYQMDVLTTSVVDTVRCAGGWLFDRSMEGWDVTVLLCTQHDVRPLQILGVGVIDMEAALIDPTRRPAALGVAADLYMSDERVRHGVRKAVRSRHLDVTMWGEDRLVDVDRSLVSAHHELSSAARAFKAHALRAAGAPIGPVQPVEAFRVAPATAASGQPHSWFMARDSIVASTD